VTLGTVPPATAAYQCDAARVLVVDDDPALLRLVNCSLGSRGYHVDEANSLVRARERLSAGHYAAILTDLDLTATGTTEGIEVVQMAVRQAPRPLVVLWTGGGRTTLDSESVRLLGADAVLGKPAGLHTFIELLLVHVPPPLAPKETSHGCP
jgi:CheY-like chemotaxis protein